MLAGTGAQGMSQPHCSTQQACRRRAQRIRSLQDHIRVTRDRRRVWTPTRRRALQLCKVGGSRRLHSTHDQPATGRIVGAVRWSTMCAEHRKAYQAKLETGEQEKNLLLTGWERQCASEPGSSASRRASERPRVLLPGPPSLREFPGLRSLEAGCSRSLQIAAWKSPDANVMRQT